MDIATLGIELQGDKEIHRKLDKIEKKSKTTQKATDRLFDGKKISATQKAFVKQQQQINKIAQSYKEADAAAQAYWADIRKNANKVGQDLKKLKQANIQSFDKEDIRLYRKELGSTETQLRKLKGKIPDEEFNKLQHEISESRRALNRFQDSQKKVARGAGKLHTALGKVGSIAATVAGAGAFGYLTKRTLESVATLKQQAETAGTSVKAFEELSYAAKQYKVTVEALRDGLKELNLRADEFIETGAGPAKEAFKRLGLSQDELASKIDNTSELFMELIQRMKGLDRAAQIRIADEIFGGSGGEEFVSLIRAGADSIEELRKRANELGIVIDDEVAEKSIKANKALDTLIEQLKTQFINAISELAPQLEDAAEHMSDWVSNNKNFIKQDIPGHLQDTADYLRDILDIYNSIPQEVRGGLGVVGAALFGKKAAVLVGILELIPSIANSMRGFKAVFEGQLDFLEFATMNAEELEKALENLDEQAGIYRGKIEIKGQSPDDPLQLEGMTVRAKKLEPALQDLIVPIEDMIPTLDELEKKWDKVIKQERIEDYTKQWKQFNEEYKKLVNGRIEYEITKAQERAKKMAGIAKELGKDEEKVWEWLSRRIEEITGDSAKNTTSEIEQLWQDAIERTQDKFATTLYEPLNNTLEDWDNDAICIADNRKRSKDIYGQDSHNTEWQDCYPIQAEAA